MQGVRRLARDASERRATGLCVVEGVRAASDYLRGLGPVETALVSPRLHELARGPELEAAVRSALRERPDDLIETTDEVLDSVADARAPQGVVLVVRATRRSGLPSPDGRPVLVAWEVQDPGNVGALLRLAEGAGCSGLVAARAPGGAVVDPFSPKAVRAAAGSAFRVSVHEWEEAPAALARELRDAGFELVACVPRGGVLPEDADLTGSCALLVGSEGHGLPEALQSGRVTRVTIPLAGAAESLNAATAAAVIAFESARQRRG